MAHSYTNLLVHVLFSTKYREKRLSAEIRKNLFPYLAAVLNDQGCKVLIVGGGLEHVHILLRIRPDRNVAALVRHAKTYSCRMIRGRFDRGFQWQSSYTALSVSESQRQRVYEYITNQEEHHKRVDFDCEYVSLLKRNEIRFDLERLWKSEG